jgi:hypothetical protein
MPVLYTKRKIQEVLKELSIRTLEGRVDADEAARILSWRAKSEQGIDHEYTPNNIRKHKKKLETVHPSMEDGKPNTRVNLYLAEKVFELDIEPKRTNRGKAKLIE